MKRFLSIFFVLFIATILVKAQVPNRSIDYFLQQAVKSSPNLRDFKNQREALKIDSLLILAGKKPQVTVSAAGMYAPIINGYGYDEVISNGQSLEALLNINYDVLNKKRTSNQLEAIKLQNDSISYASNLSIYDLNRSIIDQYIVAYASQQEVEFNKEVLKLFKQEESLLKQLTRENVYKQSEYLVFLVTLQQQQLALKQAEIQYKNDYANLNYLVGVKDTSVISLTEPVINESSLMTNGQFFTQKYDLDSLRKINQKKAIDLNYQPKFGVYANSGYSSSFTLQPYKNFGASVGFTIAIPIYDGHQRKMQYDKLAYSTQTASIYKEFFKKQQQQQLAMIVQQINNTNELFGQITEQIKFAKGLIAVDAKLLRTGDVKIADYIIAVNNYRSAENLWRQTHINRLKLINQFNYWNK